MADDDVTTDETTDEAVSNDSVNNLPTDGEIIAAKGADIDETSSTDFVKVFVLSMGTSPEDFDYDHGPNELATRNAAIQAGLRPTGDVTVKSVEENEHGPSAWDVTYAVPVEVAWTSYDVETDPAFVDAPDATDATAEDDDKSEDETPVALTGAHAAPTSAPAAS